MKYFLRPYRSLYSLPGAVALGALLAVGGSMAGLTVEARAQGTQVGQLVKHARLLLHTPSQSYLGVDVGDIDQERAAALHLKDTHGVEITVLDHDAPAGKVGLRLHDVILQMNGQVVENAEQAKRMLRETPVGRKVHIVFSRDGAQQALTVQMANRRKMQDEAREQIGMVGTSGPSQGFLASGADIPSSGGFHFWGMGNSLKVGALVEPLTAQMADFLGVSSGLMIKSVAHRSAADAAGLKQHDVILGIGSEAVVTSSDWERLLRTNEGKPVQVEILRDRTKQLVLLQVDGKRHKS
ncbi:PDZ domain-containing protein [Acidicapsa ligni]|uniref:PDZ domain-containing protein n=1 Tax=Acidicapsa ligni TaxID=542300 RepID=UPI0021DFAC11|nr:PDZ domain-containing protein [Acidicapsa ligni]